MEKQPNRLATFSAQRANLAREFLDHYAATAIGTDVLAAWHDWAEIVFDLPPLTDVEKDCLLWAVTHVAEGPKQGKIRVMLDRPPGQQFTRLHDEPDHFHVSEADIERISAGDLKRGSEETWLSYVRRLAIGLGFMEEGARAPLAPMPELRLPYKDPPDPIVARTPDAYIVEVAEAPYCGCGHQVDLHREGRCTGSGCLCGSEARQEEERGDRGDSMGPERNPVPRGAGREAVAQEQVKEADLDW